MLNVALSVDDNVGYCKIKRVVNHIDLRKNSKIIRSIEQDQSSHINLLTMEEKATEKIASLLHERQENKHKLAILESQLVEYKEKNKKSTTQMDRLNSQVLAQMNQINELQKNNKEEVENKPSLLLSESELLKTNIQSQPDLLQRKVLENSDEQTFDTKGMDQQSAGTRAKTKFKSELSGAVEFGFSYEQDNQVVRAVNGRLILNYEQANLNKLNSNFKFEVKDEDDERSAEKFRWQLQEDHYLDSQNSLFARSDLQRSQFASYEQEDIYTVGYGRIIFDHDKHKFNIEVGSGYRMAVPNADDDSINEFIFRTNLNYERIISESLQIKMNSAWEKGYENSIYSATFKAQNKIYRELYLIFNTEYKYTKNVPAGTLNDEFSTGLNLMYAF